MAGTGSGQAEFRRRRDQPQWYGDGTEIVTGEGKLYLDSVLDMGSRRIVGFALGAHHDAALAYGALAMAVAVRGGAVPGVVFHTDQGSEYTAGSFRAACERLGIAQSMGRPGSALDNAVIESWHSTLEFELRSLRKLHHQGRPQVSGRRVDRGLQPGPPALRARDAQPGGLRAVAGGKGRRVTAAGPLRGPGKEAAAPPLALLRPLRVRGRPSGLQGAAHRAARDGPAGRPGPRRPLRPLGTGKAGRPQACPARKRAQQGQPVLATITTTEVSTVVEGNFHPSLGVHPLAVGHPPGSGLGPVGEGGAHHRQNDLRPRGQVC